mmetsp:Transcript_143422/g.458723  ORF Transcript_143422/g.458723 Transcript_143422/m.458723 type:complete len:85 (-) Transcript_143422:95-349(-)|eukprot:CAMPEP_0203919056 /NCGR_PEP_ID=MMETSP0359-20131031/59542_1 /ASSEMBLY_ACC=CAM_ASM_000338 /TAXON_ID=268821 /ORGANISM="Scrippsiella Hangoei, Strain SHTV-5" /LENGTH=84 /DNA_ID=CAMNT_0050846269 /DNA_START=218 /DNA_END=472 /DNA_ORIENTATION=-
MCRASAHLVEGRRRTFDMRLADATMRRACAAAFDFGVSATKDCRHVSLAKGMCQFFSRAYRVGFQMVAPLAPAATLLLAPASPV